MPPINLNVLELAERRPDEDFKALVKRVLGEWLDKNDYVLYSKVLVATYIKPRKSKGGIIFTDTSADEDRFQGKVGLVLKVGPSAFKYDGNSIAEFDEDRPTPKVGDYILHHASDAREVGIRKISCKFIESSLILGVINDPEDYI